MKKIKEISDIEWKDLPAIESPFFARAEIEHDRSITAVYGISGIVGLNVALREYVWRHSPHRAQDEEDSRAAYVWLLKRVDDGIFVLLDSPPFKHVLRWSMEDYRKGYRVPLTSGKIDDYVKGRWIADPELPMMMRSKIDRCLEQARRSGSHAHIPEHLWWEGLLGKRLGESGKSDAPELSPFVPDRPSRPIQTASSGTGISAEEARLLKQTPPRTSKKAFEATMCQWACACISNRGDSRQYQKCVDKRIRAQYYDKTQHPYDNSPVWAEVNYYKTDVGNGKTKWKMLESQTYPGKPSSWYPSYEGTRRIDVIKVGPNGPEIFYDMKFKDDDPTFDKDKQRLGNYERIAKDNGGEYNTFVVDEKCKCEDDDRGKKKQQDAVEKEIRDVFEGKKPGSASPPTIFPPGRRPRPVRR